MGRPCRLTPDVQAAVVDAIQAGNYAYAAATHAGISESTYYAWLKRGRNALDVAKPKAEDRRFLEFVESVTRASANAEVQAVAYLRKAMPGDWRAALAYLERRHPARWRRRTER